MHSLFAGLCFLICAVEIMPPLQFDAKWISHPENGSVAVQFSSNIPCGGGLEYRLSGEKNWHRIHHTMAGQIVRDDWLHRFRLRGEPGKVYEYRGVLIHPEEREKEFFSSVEKIRLPSAEKRSYSFAAMADFQFSREACLQLISTYSRLTGMGACDFVATLGDMSMEFRSMDADVLEKWVRPVTKSFPSLPWVPVRGNHEWRGGASVDWVRTAGEPESTLPYYAFRYGPDCFVVLDSYEDKPDRWGKHTYTFFHDSGSYRREQRQWLEKVVESPLFKDARYRIVLIHCTAYGQANGFNVQYVRELTAGLLDRETPQYRVHLMLGGHLHTYMRGMPKDDLLYWYEPTERQLKSSRTSGKYFPYPVVLQDGPGGACDSSASRVDVSDKGIEVRSFVKNGTVIDHILFKPDGTAQVMVSPPGRKVTDRGAWLKDGTVICPVFQKK